MVVYPNTILTPLFTLVTLIVTLVTLFTLLTLLNLLALLTFRYGSYLLLFVSFAFDRFRPVTKSSPREERSTDTTGPTVPTGKEKRKGTAHLKQP